MTRFFNGSVTFLWDQTGRDEGDKEQDESQTNHRLTDFYQQQKKELAKGSNSKKWNENFCMFCGLKILGGDF